MNNYYDLFGLRYMFWSDWAPERPSVNRANLDGSNVKRLFESTKVMWPNGVAVDYIAERLYWVDAREDYIASCNMDGNNVIKVISKEVRPFLHCSQYTSFSLFLSVYFRDVTFVLSFLEPSISSIFCSCVQG